jgi:hypothetical protein
MTAMIVNGTGLLIYFLIARRNRAATTNQRPPLKGLSTPASRQARAVLAHRGTEPPWAAGALTHIHRLRSAM